MDLQYRKQVWNGLEPIALLMQQNLKRQPHDDPRPQDHAWLIPGRASPGSMTDEEGMILYELIRMNGLKNGFELCTGFGYSTMFTARAFKETGGRLRTLDCYVEEWKESWLYNRKELNEAIARVKGMIEKGANPEGLALAKRFAKELDLSKFIEFHLGVSPEDVPAVMGNEKMDYVLIDGGHDGEQPLQDWIAVRPFLSDRCVVIFHDCHSFAHPVRRALKAAEEDLGISAVHLKTRCALSIIGRNLKPETFPTLESLCIRRWPRPIHEKVRASGIQLKKKVSRLLAKLS